MNDANDRIKALMNGYSDITIKAIILEYQQLQNTGLLPAETSLYKELTKRICDLYGVAYNLRMGESWLTQEVFRRFSQKVIIDHVEKLEEKKSPKTWTYRQVYNLCAKAWGYKNESIRTFDEWIKIHLKK